jgi:hypothetical protein
MPHGLAPLDLFINAICLFQLISRYIYYAPLELNIIPLLIILLTFRSYGAYYFSFFIIPISFIPGLPIDFFASIVI